MIPLEKLLQESISQHGRLCPRQVLGVRVGLAGGAALGMQIPSQDKHLMVIVETDGCFVSGVEVATGCAIRHRTMRVVDCGKMAATFVDVVTGRAVRVAPRLNVRQRAWDYAPSEERRYDAQLKGYQVMPVEELLSIERVSLTWPIDELISRPGLRVNCDDCGEEIINERHVYLEEQTLCRTCAGSAYYQPVSSVDLAYDTKTITESI